MKAHTIARLLILAFVIATLLALSACSKQTYIRAPVESCTATNTGRVSHDLMPVQQCAGYNNQGACTAPFTTYVEYTNTEVRVVCDFTEWRSS